MDTAGVDDDEPAADVETLLPGVEPRRPRAVHDQTRVAVAATDVVRLIARVRLADRCSRGRWLLRLSANTSLWNIIANER